METTSPMMPQALLLNKALALRSKKPTDSEILDAFLSFAKEKNLELYEAQEEALLELYTGKNVVLNTPTGSGKSLVALGLHFLSFVRGKRSVYTCPIKALVNEKFLSLCRDFGPDQVGMITGDTTVNPEAPIVCCTAEILANQALSGRAAGVDSSGGYTDIIMDEFHYYADSERGVAWQIPLIVLTNSRFLLMSATMGEAAPIKRALSERTGLETVTISSQHRPVPLDFQYSELPLHEAVQRLVAAKRYPIYVVSFTQKGCAEEAQNFMSLDLSSKEEKQAIAQALEGFKFSSPYGAEIRKLLRHGFGIHHAGLLPKYRVLVEGLAQKGLLKLIFGTDTLGVGVNVPIRTVLFTKLCKFDGTKTTILSVRDFQQISGRAGRKGFDDLGTVVVQAPEHVIENLKMEQKAAGDSKKLRKLVKRKPPEKGYVPWTRETFEKLIKGTPEPLVSRFQVTHAMLLQVLGRPTQGSAHVHCEELRALIRHSHESDYSKRQHGKKAWELFRSLVDRKIIELGPLRINVDLQEDFSLNHALSLYLVDTVRALYAGRGEGPFKEQEYAANVLTLVESILENPEFVLRRQLDRIKTEKMNEMKSEGVDYDQRIEELEKLEYPKPNRDFIYSTFNDFARLHPWVGQENIRPKSIAREMFESYFSFAEYIREYGLQRGEGLLLRYLFDVYKALVQSVPSTYKNEETLLIEDYFGTMLKSIDSSLLDEWEKMRNPAWVRPSPKDLEGVDEPARRFPHPIKDARAFRVLVRNAAFRMVRSLAGRDYEELLAFVMPQSKEAGWTLAKLESIMEQYYASDQNPSGKMRIKTDANARAPEHLEMGKAGSFERSSPVSRISCSQVLVDSEEDNDWQLEFDVDYVASVEKNELIVCLTRIGPIGGR